MRTAIIALGGNIGDVAQTFSTAIGLLSADSGIVVKKCSQLYETTPVGNSAGGVFVNAAIKIETSNTALELLDRLLHTEMVLGRERSIHWGPRLIDLDLVLYNESIVRESRLNVPHPACWYRRFVLDPVVEIAPDAIHPVKKQSFQTILEHICKGPFSVAVAGGSENTRNTVIKEMTVAFPTVTTHDWSDNLFDETCGDPNLIAWIGETQEGESDNDAGIEHLPILPRLDVTTISDETVPALKHVIQSAIDEPKSMGRFPAS